MLISTVVFGWASLRLMQVLTRRMQLGAGGGEVQESGGKLEGPAPKGKGKGRGRGRGRGKSLEGPPPDAAAPTIEVRAPVEQSANAPPEAQASRPAEAPAPVEAGAPPAEPSPTPAEPSTSRKRKATAKPKAKAKAKADAAPKRKGRKVQSEPVSAPNNGGASAAEPAEPVEPPHNPDDPVPALPAPAPEVPPMPQPGGDLSHIPANKVQSIREDIANLLAVPGRWDFLLKLFAAMYAEPTRATLPKFTHYTLSVYWGKARVGLVEKAAKRHLLSFSSSGSGRIGLPLEATLMYVRFLIVSVHVCVYTHV